MSEFPSFLGRKNAGAGTVFGDKEKIDDDLETLENFFFCFFLCFYNGGVFFFGIVFICV